MKINKKQSQEFAVYVADTTKDILNAIKNEFGQDNKALLKFLYDLKYALKFHIEEIYTNSVYKKLLLGMKNNENMYMRLDVGDDDKCKCIYTQISQKDFDNKKKEFMLLTNFKYTTNGLYYKIHVYIESYDDAYVIINIHTDDGYDDGYDYIRILDTIIYTNPITNIFIDQLDEKSDQDKEKFGLIVLYSIIDCIINYIHSIEELPFISKYMFIEHEIYNIMENGIKSKCVVMTSVIKNLNKAFCDIKYEELDGIDDSDIDPLIKTYFKNDLSDTRTLEAYKNSKANLIRTTEMLVPDSALFELNRLASEEVCDIMTQYSKELAHAIETVRKMPSDLIGKFVSSDRSVFLLIGFGKSDSDGYGIYVYENKDHMCLFKELTDMIDQDCLSKVRIIYDLIKDGYTEFELKSFDDLQTIWEDKYKPIETTKISKSTDPISCIQNVIDGIYNYIIQNKLITKKDMHMKSFAPSLMKYMRKDLFDRYSVKEPNGMTIGIKDVLISVMVKTSNKISSYNLHCEYSQKINKWSFTKYDKPFRYFIKGKSIKSLFDGKNNIDTIIHIGNQNGYICIDVDDITHALLDGGCSSISEALDNLIVYIASAIRMIVSDDGNTLPLKESKKKRLNSNHFRIENPSFDTIIKFMEDNKIYNLIDDDGFDKINAAITAGDLSGNAKPTYRDYIVSYDSPNRDKIVRVNRKGEIYEIRKSKKEVPFFSNIVLKYGSRHKNGFDLFINENKYSKSSTFTTDLSKIFNYMRFLKEEEEKTNK